MLMGLVEEDCGSVAEEPFAIGSCVECQHEVLNDGSGCSAMDKVRTGLKLGGISSLEVFPIRSLK